MRKSVFLACAASVALAACNSADEADDTVVEDVAMEEEAVEMPLAADGQPTPGTYEVTLANGDVWTEVVNADGTYSSTGPDGEIESGTWTQESPSRYCTTMDGSTETRCFEESISADGVWSSTEEGTDETAIVVRTG